LLCRAAPSVPGGPDAVLELEDAVAIGAHDLATLADREEDARMAQGTLAAVAGNLGLGHLDDLNGCGNWRLDHTPRFFSTRHRPYRIRASPWLPRLRSPAAIGPASLAVRR